MPHIPFCASLCYATDKGFYGFLTPKLSTILPFMPRFIHYRRQAKQLKDRDLGRIEEIESKLGLYEWMDSNSSDEEPFSPIEKGNKITKTKTDVDFAENTNEETNVAPNDASIGAENTNEEEETNDAPGVESIEEGTNDSPGVESIEETTNDTTGVVSQQKSTQKNTSLETPKAQSNVVKPTVKSAAANTNKENTENFNELCTVWYSFIYE